MRTFNFYRSFGLLELIFSICVSGHVSLHWGVGFCLWACLIHSRVNVFTGMVAHSNGGTAFQFRIRRPSGAAKDLLGKPPSGCSRTEKTAEMLWREKKKEAEEPSGLSALLPWALSSRNIIIYQKTVRVGTALKNGHVRVRIIYFKVRIFIGDNWHLVKTVCLPVNL